jgi:hypothetical protein
MLVRVVEASGRPGYEQVPQQLREWVERDDWAWACQGAAWIDTMNLICGVAMDRTDIDVDALISASPRTREIEPGILTAYLANTAGSAYVKAQQSGPQNIPALQAFRQRRATALLDWLQRRTGW